MKLRLFSALLLTASFLTPQLLISQVLNQQPALTLPRLASGVLDVSPPSTRVKGLPGAMQIVERSCRNGVLGTDMRRRIVNTAVQEWAFFGFQVEDQRNTASVGNTPNTANTRRRFGPLDPIEVARVADSVGGYWAATPGSDWILQRQNDAWNSSSGLASRWRDPWSAAFISWVMCESGLDDEARFKRAIAHHTYIDQAIKARDSNSPDAAYVAYEPGEQTIVPGDMLCNGLRPMYRSLAERRAQLGVGARTHCDIVVQVNEAAGQILTIGGNVRSSVRLKIFPAGDNGKANFAPLRTARTIFAHLKLRTDTIEANALSNSPTVQNMGCSMPAPAVFTIASIDMPSASC